MREPLPLIFVRCLLQSLIFRNYGIPERSTTKELLYKDLEELVLPASLLLDPANEYVEAPHDDRFQIARRMERAVDTICDVCV